jgi:histidinol-phosphate aminotransferase
VRDLGPDFEPYSWAPSTEELARRAELDPVEIVRFDGNVPPLPLPSSRPGALASALAEINTYPHGGYPRIHEAIAEYAGVERENVVLGAGADDLIMLVARAYAGPGDTIAIPPEPTYPVFRVAAQLAGARIGDDGPVLTFACRPGNPYGDLPPLPAARPLAVDEAYFEYAGGETAAGLIGEDVVVIRTFSKAFAMAGARIGYLLAAPDTAAALQQHQAPAQVSTLSVALALAALRTPPDVTAVVEERERLAAEFAERFALDHLSMDDEFWSRLHAAFADDELVDLGLCVGSWIAFGRLNRVFDVDGACRVPLHSQSPS